MICSGQGHIYVRVVEDCGGGRVACTFFSTYSIVWRISSEIEGGDCEE